MTTKDRERYLSQLTVSLRLRDVPAAAIRDLVDEVHAHLDESGDDPDTAFGPPDRLAAGLADGRTIQEAGTRPSRPTVRGLADGVLVSAGAVLLLEVLAAGVRDEPAVLTLGMVVMLPVLALGTALALPVLWRTLDGRGALLPPVAALAAVWAAVFGALLVLRQPLLELPVGPAAAVAVLLLVAGGVRIARSADPLPAPRVDA